MRSERFEKSRREASMKAKKLKSRGDQLGLDELGFNPDYPWDCVFKLAAADDKFWEQEVEKPALFHLASPIWISMPGN